jgi:DNA replication protein DnaC
MNDKEREENWRIQRTEQLIRRSHIPRATQTTRRLDKTFVTTPGNEGAVQAVKDFLGGAVEPPILFLYGTLGLGKSRLAFHIAWEYIENGWSVLYYQAEDLLNQLQACQVDGKEFGHMWSEMKKVELLILDDVGANNATEWRWSQLDAIIDYRYRESRPLVITANKLDLPERVLDRLKEGRTALLRGESWRGKGMS